MMKRKTELSKKVLLSVLAAGVMSTCVMGSALAGDVNKTNETITTDQNKCIVSTKGESIKITLDNMNISNQSKLVLDVANVSDKNGIKDANVTTVITNSKFSGNKAGALAFNGNGNITISNTSFSENESITGAGIYFGSYMASDKIKVDASGKTITANLDNVRFSNNKASWAGGAILVYPNINLNISDSVFDGNIATSNNDDNYGGAIMLKAGKVVLTNVDFDNNKTISTNSTKGAMGGAILVDKTTSVTDGAQATVGDITFKVTKDISYTGNEVQGDISDSTNTYGYWAYTSGGLLFVDRSGIAKFDVADGATLTIGEAEIGDKTEYVDSIASALPDPQGQSLGTLTKTGSGTVVMNGSMNKYFGNFYIEDGKFNITTNEWSTAGHTFVNGGELITKDIKISNVEYKGGNKQTGSIKTAAGSTLTAKNITVNAGSIEAAGNVTADSLVVNDGTVTFNGNSDTEYSIANKLTAAKADQITLSGGTLKADNLKALTDGSAENGIKLTGNGVISTMSNQVFANAASENEKSAGDVTIKTVDFQGGTLSLNDAEYTLAYAQDAGSKVKDTKVVMTGKLADAVNDTIKVDEAAVIGDNVALDKVTAEADGSLLVGSENSSISEGANVEGIEIKDKVQNGFAVGALNLAVDSKGVVITNDKEVTLGGSQGGNVITVGGADKEVKVVVGTTQDITGVTSKVGNLNIGNTLATADTKYKLNGDVVINQDSNLNVNGTTEITKSLTLNDGTVAVNNGSLATDKLDITHGGSGISNLSGTVNANELSVAANTTLAIGDNEDAGKLTVKDAKLNGGMLFLDPAFKDGATIGDASGFAVTDASSALDGAYVAGRNSKLSFGADLKAAEAVFAKTGETWGEKGVTAAAYIAKSIDLGTAGSITVDGSKNVAPTVAVGNATFAANSLLMVNGAEITSTAAITRVTAASVDSTSKLYIDNAKKSETYKILGGKNTAWADKNIISSNSLLKFAGDTSNANQFNVTASVQSVKDAFGGEVIAPKAYDAALNATVENAASDFIMNAADSKVNATKAVQVSALNSAAAMSELAGVSHGTYATSNLLTDAVADHMSLANEKEHDSDIWAKYIHTKEDVDGLSIASFGADYDAQYNGIVVGADLYKNGKATVGAALTYVDGNINGNTLAARTKNDATYYGASIYGGITSDDSAVIGDISYLHGKNDITQYNSGATLTADAKSDAFSIGVRAEKSVKAGVGKFVPYAGIRYMHLGTGNYTNSIGMSYDADDMNLWLLPVGVKYSADVKAGAWTIRPLAEVGYVWNMGDRDSTQTVSLNGASDGFGYDVTDSGSYIGRFMIEAEKANVTYGLGYEYQKGDSVKANRWMANLNWKF